MGMKAFGDSIVLGSNYYPFPAIIKDKLGEAALTNYGLGGAMAADIADYVFPTSVDDGLLSLLAVGTSDMSRNTGFDSEKLRQYLDIMSAYIVHLALPDSSKVKGNSTSLTVVNWSDPATYSFCRYTSTLGAYIEGQVVGDAVYICANLNNPVNGVLEVKIDNAVVGYISCAGNGKLTTALGRTYTPALYRYGNLSNTAHTVRLTHYSGDWTYFYFMAGNGDLPVAMPLLLVGNIGKLTTAGYQLHGDGNDNRVDVYNCGIKGTTGMFKSDGLDVEYIDSCSVQVPSLDLYSDGLHPVQSGYNKIAAAYYERLI